MCAVTTRGALPADGADAPRARAGSATAADPLRVDAVGIAPERVHGAVELVLDDDFAAVARRPREHAVAADADQAIAVATRATATADAVREDASRVAATRDDAAVVEHLD